MKITAFLSISYLINNRNLPSIPAARSLLTAIRGTLRHRQHPYTPRGNHSLWDDRLQHKKPEYG